MPNEINKLKAINKELKDTDVHNSIEVVNGHIKARKELLNIKESHGELPNYVVVAGYQFNKLCIYFITEKIAFDNSYKIFKKLLNLSFS